MDYRLLDKIFRQPSICPQLEYVAVDGNFQIIEVSEEAEKFSDFPECLALGKDIRLAFPELVGAEDYLLQILQGNQELFEIKGVSRLNYKDSPCYIDFYAVRDYEEDCSQLRLIIFIANTTERMLQEQRAVQRLHESHLLCSLCDSDRSYYFKIIESVPAALLVTTLSGKIKIANRCAETLLGYGEQELIGKPIGEIVADKFFCWQSLQHQKDSQFLQLMCRTKTGAQIALAFSCAAFETDVAGVYNYVCLAWPIDRADKSC